MNEQKFEQLFHNTNQVLTENLDIVTWCRFIESEYQVKQTIPENVPIFELNSAHDLYVEGVNVYAFIHEHVSKEDQARFYRIDGEIYKQAYVKFRADFKQKQSLTDVDAHPFAMCCNNFAIVLSKLGKYPEAVAIATEGLKG